MEVPHKETRKIIKVGETSFAVILPRAWLRYFNLDHNDRVEIISNSNIVIKPIARGKARARSA